MRISTLSLVFISGLLGTACRRGVEHRDAGASTAVMALDAGGAVDGASGEKAEEACLDAWLEARQLDAYGNASGTMYAGGTPLFDERTGAQTSRTDYVYRKHPAAKTACSASK